MVDTPLISLVQRTVAGVVGFPGNLVRPRWQPTQPTQPPVNVNWAAVGVTDVVRMDYPYIKHDPTANAGLGGDRLSRHLMISVLCSFYGPASDEYANMLGDGLYIPQNWELLNKAGARLYSVGDSLHAPELINMQWVGRTDLPITIVQQVDRLYNIYTIVGADGYVNSESPTSHWIVP